MLTSAGDLIKRESLKKYNNMISEVLSRASIDRVVREIYDVSWQNVEGEAATIFYKMYDEHFCRFK